MNPLDFVRDFLAYVEKVGIYDQFDADTQKMVTSPGVQKLIKDAATYLPEKLKPAEAAHRMRDLTVAERNRMIEQADAGRVLDLRKQFQEKMRRNGGAQGIVRRIAEATRTDNKIALLEALADARALEHGPENVFMENDLNDK